MAEQARDVHFRVPLAGWNTRDGLAVMNDDPQRAYCPLMENWIPGISSLVSRNGTSTWATGLDGNCKALATYNASSSKLFAFTDAKIWDVTSTGAASDTGQTLTSGKVRAINFSAANIQYLYCCNGVDKPRLYNGSAWVAVDGVSSPSLAFPGGSGFVTSNIRCIKEHQTRLWFLVTSGLSAFYLDVASVGGTLTEFPMGSIFRRGGYLVDMETWTVDGGSGTGDYFAFLTSEGEVAIYSGYDPTQASTWGWLGVFFVGRPVGDRPLKRYGGEVIVLTMNGIGQLSQLLSTAETNSSKGMLSDAINKSFAQATTLYGANYGWTILECPKENLLFVNIPLSASTSEQYVMYTLTGAWTRFTGLNASCWELLGDTAYFGTGTNVCRYETDGAVIQDSGISFRLFLRFAYAYLGTKSRKKQLTFLRPTLRLTTKTARLYEMASLVWGVDVDFADTPNRTVVDEVPLIWANTIDVGTVDSMVIGAKELLMQTPHSVACWPGLCFAPEMEVYPQGSRWEFMGLEGQALRGSFL